MPKKYSEVEELEQIRDRLIGENKDLEARLALVGHVVDGMIAERLELVARVKRLEQHASALGYNITK